MKSRGRKTTLIAVAGVAAVMAILVFGTVWMGNQAQKDTAEAVSAVSHLYLDELAGRREQVVSDNLKGRISDIKTALDMMTEEDLSDKAHMEAYQKRIKRLFSLDKFAFVDEDGLIYTSTGTQNDIDSYHIDYSHIFGQQILIRDLDASEKKVIIAVSVGDLTFEGKKLTACFMEIDMREMLAGVSMQSQSSGATFSNIYTKSGVALSNTILGGLAVEDNLLEALARAEYDPGYSYEAVRSDFENLNRGEASFIYEGIHETLSYVPVEGTDWFLTYLIRESIISEQISSISEGTLRRSIVQSVLTVAAMLAVFLYILFQSRKNAELALAQETAAAETRAKQQELDERIAMQDAIEKQSQALGVALAAAEEANRAKTAFLSNMSHEIRTPMNAIIGLDSIALNDPETPEKTRGYLQKIGDSAEHLLNLINDILDMSRIESGRLALRNEEFSFRKLLETVNTMFSGQCADKGLEYQCHINSAIDDYYIGDNMKLRQVLINILGNAVKFTPEGGSVELSVERTAQYDGKSTLVFTIADTGIGMSAEFLPRLFDTFTQEDASTTSKYGSSGLGMAITKNIVELMNGNIQVKSKKGKGSTFTVTVTLADSDRKDDGQGSGEIHPQDLCVLVVDDDPVAREHARLVLENAGIAAEVASSGEEAIEKTALRHARREPYNLILVDWQMPGLDGVETTRRIRREVGSESAIVILTAYRWDDVLEEALAAGVDSFLAKPVFAGAVMEEYRIAKDRRDSDAKQASDKADLTGRRILLAEDVAINAEIITMLLAERQMEVEHALNGRLALEAFENHPVGYYDAVLMDMRMPEMDGLEATRRIRATDHADAKSIPIIALTANAFNEDVQRSMQAGLNAHLSKPVQPEVLYETLETLIAAAENGSIGTAEKDSAEPFYTVNQ